jgi:hypothetical protein
MKDQSQPIQFPAAEEVEAAKARYAVADLPSEYCDDKWHRYPCEACAVQLRRRAAAIRAIGADVRVIRLDELAKKIASTDDEELRAIYAGMTPP